MCERLGRTEEAERYADLARRCWSQADSHRLEAELAALRGEPVSDSGAGKTGAN